MVPIWLLSLLSSWIHTLNAEEYIHCSNTNYFVNTTWQLRSGLYSKTAECGYGFSFPAGTVLIMNINMDEKFELRWIRTFKIYNEHGDRATGFELRVDKMTNFAIAFPGSLASFAFNILMETAEIPSTACRATVKKTEIKKYINYHVDANEEPLIIPLKDFHDGVGLNFSATNEVVFALVCSECDPTRLVSIHIYKNWKKLDEPENTLWELTLDFYKYIQVKNPLVYFAMAYQNAVGVLVAMDSSRIKDLNWQGLNYPDGTYHPESMELDMFMKTSIYPFYIPEGSDRQNKTHDSVTLFLNPYDSRLKGIFLRPRESEITCGYYREVPLRGNLTIFKGSVRDWAAAFKTVPDASFKGFPSKNIDESRIIRKNTDTVDFLYLEGTATTFLYRHTAPEDECTVSLLFSKKFPGRDYGTQDNLQELPYNETLTSYPNTSENNPMIFYDIGVPLKYSLNIYDPSVQITLTTSDNKSGTLTGKDGPQAVISRGLTLSSFSGSIDLRIERANSPSTTTAATVPPTQTAVITVPPPTHTAVVTSAPPAYDNLPTIPSTDDDTTTVIPPDTTTSLCSRYSTLGLLIVLIFGLY